MIKYFTEKLDKRDKEFIDTVDLQKKEISAQSQGCHSTDKIVVSLYI